MNNEDLSYLRLAFGDLLNYESEDLNQPIEPLTYRTPEGDTCLHIAASRGDTRAAGILVLAGLDIDVRGDMGTTPLHSAYRAKQAEMVDLLVRLGADENLTDEFGRIPAFLRD